MDLEGKHGITTSTSLAGMIAFVERQKNRKDKLRALRIIYEVFKDVVEQDIEARYNIIEMRKKYDIPLSLNTKDSSHFVYKPSPTVGSRNSRRSAKGKEQLDLHRQRESRMSYYGLNPQDNKHLVLYSEFLEAKKTLNKTQKKLLSRRFAGVTTKEELDKLIIEIKAK